MPASPARRSRPAEQADGKSQFLPHITNKVGTSRAALGRAPERKGVGSLPRSPLPAQPRLLSQQLPPTAGNGRAAVRRDRWTRGLRLAKPRGRRQEVASAGARGSGLARAGHWRGSRTRFLPDALDPAALARLPPPLGSSRPHVPSHARMLSHTSTPPFAHRVTHTLCVTRTLVPTHTPCLSHTGTASPGQHACSNTVAASHARDTRGGTRTQPHVPSFTPGLCHTASSTHTDPHTRSHTFRLSHAGRRPPSPLQPLHRLAGIRSHRLPHTELHAVPAGSPGMLPSARTRSPQTHTNTCTPHSRQAEPPAHAPGAFGCPAGAAPEPCAISSPVYACGKSEDLPCGPFGSSPPPGQLRGPSPEQLVFVPTSRAGGVGWRGGRVIRSRAEQPGAGGTAGQPGRLHLPPGISAPETPRPAPLSLPLFIITPPLRP